jgi:hypothetical protein
MRIIVFILAIINLIYIPIKICIKDACAYRKYDFIFSIPNNYQLDYEKLGLQLLILAILFAGTYSNLYRKLTLKIKKIDKEEKVSENLLNIEVLGGIVIIAFWGFLIFKLFNFGTDKLSEFVSTLGEKEIVEIKKKESSSNSSTTISDFITAHNDAMDAGKEWFKFNGQAYRVGSTRMADF